MYKTIHFIHSYWAYLVLFMVLVAALNALSGVFSKKEFTAKDFRLSLFALIVTHIQLVVGLIIYFVSPFGTQNISSIGMGEVMKNSLFRLYVMEHPLMMIIAIILITIGYSKHKKKVDSKEKFKTLAIFYTIGLIFMLSRIPWSQWF